MNVHKILLKVVFIFLYSENTNALTIEAPSTANISLKLHSIAWMASTIGILAGVLILVLHKGSYSYIPYNNRNNILIGIGLFAIAALMAITLK